MEDFDDVTLATLRAANISEDTLHTLSRDDIRDLFPGPEHFLRRKDICLKIHAEDHVYKIKCPVKSKSKAPPANKQRQVGDADESLSSTFSDL
ncbi:hypothetical protein AALO_G00202220 [Alosa alosa]|uniref:Uncharacterized protein n=1 Tax=Alosa alosa TaxID=278164 RepID=A0AAV6G491_9TELE|nr:hypothetical protein AALO_G00202220 [Alosa alosa]